jgi:CDP-diacylglycerol--glycerol-3-phosphate 3-phosphatidyltransferase
MFSDLRRSSASDILSAYQSALSSLRKRWLVFAVFCVAALAGSLLLVYSGWHSADPGTAALYTLRWGLVSAVLIVYVLQTLWSGLPANSRTGELLLLPDLGAGNLLTLLRGVFIAFLGGFLLLPVPQGWFAWAPAVLYTAAAAADYLDGYLARVTRHATRLGELLDMNFDGIGVFVGASLAIQYGKVPAWYLVIALARYIFLAGVWIRKRQGKPVFELPPSVSRRAFAGVQMGFLAALLWPVFTPPGTSVAALFFAFPFLAGFMRDWLFTTGVLSPVEARQAAWRLTLLRWAPVALRLGVLITSIMVILPRLPAIASWLSLPGSQASPGVAGQIIMTVLGIAALLAVVLGAAGRASAILALGLLGIQQFYTGFTLGEVVLVALY